jgi:hypothetical protein
MTSLSRFAIAQIAFRAHRRAAPVPLAQMSHVGEFDKRKFALEARQDRWHVPDQVAAATSEICWETILTIATWTQEGLPASAVQRGSPSKRLLEPMIATRI